MQKSERAITLVALVITIILLLILAGISISALTNQGLFAKAQDAKKQSEIANIKEKIQLDIYEKQLEPPVGSITDAQLKTILEKYFTDVPETLPEDLSTLTLTSKSEYGSYSIKVTDVYNGTTIKGTQKPTLASKVQPGDYVTYTPDPVNAATTTDLLGEISTYSGNTDDTLNTSSNIRQETSLKWRVLDKVKDEDGNDCVRLISEMPTTSTVALEGYNGYNNAVYLLDKTCRTLYSKAGYSENVQNLKIEDIQKYMTTTDYSTIDSSYGKTNITPSSKYYPSILLQEEGQTVTTSDGTTQPTTRLGLSEQETPINQTTPNTATSWTVKYTYWNKEMVAGDFTNSIYYNLFINNESDYSPYWMSSRCVAANSNDAAFDVRAVYFESVDANSLCSSYDPPYGDACALRPVVTLNSNVQVKSGEGTPTSAYEI